MSRLGVISLVLLSFTGISVAHFGKAMLTPFHLFMGLMIVWAFFYSVKSNLGSLSSLNLLAMYVIGLNIYHYQDMRFTSLLYTVVFILELTILYNLIKHCKPIRLRDTFKWIIYLYFVNILFGTLLIAAGLNIPALEAIIGIVRTSAGTRPMGFSSEPSYASFILGVSYLAFNHINQHRFSRTTRRVTVIYLLSVILLKSSYGFLFVLINGLDWFRHYYFRFSSNLRVLFIFVLAISLAGGVQVIGNSDNEAIRRLEDVGIILFDPFSDTEKKIKKLKEKDPSAFARIGPSYLLFFSEESKQFNFWIGEGAGAAGVYVPKFMAGILIDEDDNEFDTGILPAFIFDYGIIGFALLVTFMIFCFGNLPFPFWWMCILILPNCNINTQLFWFGMASFLIVSVIKQTRKYHADSSGGNDDPVIIPLSETNPAI